MLDLEQLALGEPRYDFTREEIQAIYDLPITTLVYLAQSVHRRYYAPDEIQMSTLLSIKTGGCKENCAYCPQSAHYATGVESHGLLPVDTIVAAAKEAKENGSSRFCMGAAWRNPPKKGQQFEQVLEAVRMAAGLEHRQVAGEVGLLVGEGVVDRVAHARLGGEVHDPPRPLGPHQRAEALGVGDVEADHPEAGQGLEPGGPGGLQGRVVVVVEVVHPHDALAAAEQAFGHVHADEPGCAGDDDRRH